MRNQSITLHLTKPNASRTFSTLVKKIEKISLGLSHSVLNRRTPYLDGLARNWINGTRGPYLEFVQYHMSKTLVVHDTEVNVRRELLACDSGIHWLVAIVVVSCGEKLLAEVVNGSVFF